MTVSELLPDDARILGSYTMVGREPASRADYTDADWLMESRRLLLQSEEVRRRLRADDRLEQLVMDLDGHFGLWELQNAAANLRSGRDPAVAVTLVTGRIRQRARRLSASTIEIAAASLVLRAGGLTATQADERVAGELPHRPGHPVSPTLVCQYRKRLRDARAATQLATQGPA